MISGLAKAELHLHLEGSIEPETLIEIDPSLTRAGIAANTPSGSFANFLAAFVWVNRRLLTPAHYALAARRLLERLAAQNVQYAEITLSAGVVLWKQQDLPAVYDALWQESLRSPVRTRWILDAVRQFGAQPAMDVARFAVTRRREGVVAFGLGGDEARGPAEWFRDVFKFARDGGLRLTCHAGETAGPESIRAALAIGAERIGHGTTAVADPALLALLRDRNVPLEVCISSNAATGVIARVEDHPVGRMHAEGVPVVLNTDDPAFFNTTLVREYELAERLFGLPPTGMAANSFRYAFDAQSS